MSINVFEQNFWVLIKPADDVPGQWVGHCLDLDIVSVGTSLSHAIAMTAEAVCECITDDLAHGRYPLERRPAPAEFFEELRRVQSKGEYAAADDLPSDAAVIAAVQFKTHVSSVILVEPPRLPASSFAPLPPPRVERLPPAWMIAKYNAAERHVGA